MEEIIITKRNIKPYKSNYEFDQAKRLEDNGIKFEYEPVQFAYKQSLINVECEKCGNNNLYKFRKYTPDFWFPKSKIFVETKGKFTPEGRKAMEEIVTQAPDEVRMVFMFDNWLTKKHSMRYSRWCELHGIQYAIGNIPLSWVGADKRGGK